MKHHLAIFALGASLLGACVPLSIYHKPGVAVSVMERDRTRCEVSAAQDVPISRQLRRTPPRYIPAQRRCDGAGNCTVREGHYLPGRSYTVDINEGLRKRAAAQCMADRGYLPVDIPTCRQNVAQSLPAAATQVLPRLGPNACVIRNQGGSWQIVNP